MSHEPHALSARQTFLYKFVFPILWLGGFAGLTLSFFLSPQSWRDANGPAPGSIKWILLSVTLAGSLFIRWICRLKRIRMDDDSLYISNYRKEILVPLANVAEVTENFWTDIHPVTIRFRSDTDFGSSVTFMPKFRFFDFSSHPVVEEIRATVRRATGLEPR